MKSNDSRNNDEVLIAATSSKSHLRRLLRISISFVLALILLSFFLISTKPSNQNEQAFKLNESQKKQKDGTASNQNSISFDSFKIHFQNYLKPKLEKIANNNDIYERKNIFSKEANDLLIRCNNIIVRREKHKEPPDTETLQYTTQQADALINKFDSTFDKYMHRINESFLDKDYKNFQRSLDGALLLAPSDKRLAKWKDLAPVAEILFKQFQIAETAEVEKRFSAALAALKKIKELGYSNENVNKKLTNLSSVIARKQYNHLTFEARKNRDEGKFLLALRNINEAQKLFPKENNLESLKLEIEEKRNTKLAIDWKEKADAEAAADDWINALAYFKKALELTPSDKNIIDGKELASKIIRYKNALLQFKEKPLRLTDINVSNYAKNILAESSLVEIHSISLSRMRSDVTSIMAEILRPRDVVITSDGKTKIEVKGVGFVEPTIEKTIQLRPGKYIVHAACPGHKTNLLTLEVSATDFIKAKRIVCGERI